MKDAIRHSVVTFVTNLANYQGQKLQNRKKTLPTLSNLDGYTDIFYLKELVFYRKELITYTIQPR